MPGSLNPATAAHRALRRDSTVVRIILRAEKSDQDGFGSAYSVPRETVEKRTDRM
jgi:hypothetical protein